MNIHDLAQNRIRKLFPAMEAALSRCRVRAYPFPELAGTRYCRQHLAALAAVRSVMPSTSAGFDHSPPSPQALCPEHGAGEHV